MRSARNERGATLVEFAFIFLFMMMLAIGSFEWGLGFLDQLSVSQAVREAGRTGAAVGDYYVNGDANADCAIIEAASGALSAIGGNDVKEIWIYQSDKTGTVGANKQRFRPKVDSDDPLALKCGSGWYPIQENWAPSSRDTTGASRDWIGLRVILDHEWKTGFLWWSGTTEWQESVVFHLEPKAIG
jgi:hypothetical protein